MRKKPIYTCSVFIVRIQAVFLDVQTSKMINIMFVISLFFVIQEAMKQTEFLDSLLAGFKDANKTKLAVKTRSIEMLPLILKQCSAREQVDTVCTQVGKYVAEAFPISSEDLVQGTAPYLDYMTQLDQVSKIIFYQ